MPSRPFQDVPIGSKKSMKMNELFVGCVTKKAQVSWEIGSSHFMSAHLVLTQTFGTSEPPGLGSAESLALIFPLVIDWTENIEAFAPAFTLRNHLTWFTMLVYFTSAPAAPVLKLPEVQRIKSLHLCFHLLHQILMWPKNWPKRYNFPEDPKRNFPTSLLRASSFSDGPYARERFSLAEKGEKICTTAVRRGLQCCVSLYFWRAWWSFVWSYQPKSTQLRMHVWICWRIWIGAFDLPTSYLGC